MVAAAREDRGGRAEHAELDLLRNVCDRDPGQVACARSATSPSGRSRATSTSSATSSRRTSTRAGARSAATRRSKESWRRSTSTAPPDRRGARMSHVRGRPGRNRDMCPGPGPGDGVCSMSMPEMVTRHRSTAARFRCRRALGSSRRRSRPGSRSPSSVTSRGSGRPSAPAACASSRSRACRSSQAGCTLTATGRDGRQDGADLREGRRGAERDARVHPRQPPARLPRLRQGRRVPAPGPDVPLRARRARG